ncbi:7-cyano-7-deazaguanine synthase QueC [Solwaraspora sp. WMMD1047]|uniref:7-cyano-7-deazaguanine synthase QueC n=1 Tax=Solwaraspora sp. WMMD1047 TaxID=3016102 RepID=UPI0024159A25|nr:7-cyano-7-deazaguanine synthase QueC [Solwaraspora sp. WMMD1047]MDG4830004.1 7-cyano-7-deazaguanine synthase QueC [Solwaraspora sp. WMMD1047]
MTGIPVPGGPGLAGSHPPPRHAVVIVSGGLDSTVVTYWLHQLGTRLSLLSVDYGQRHRIELEHARRTAAAVGAAHDLVDLSGIGAVLTGSALTDDAVEMPDGHYTDASMRSTVVPNRNATMLDIAVAVAVARRADAVVFGAHAGDHPIYPDCRPEFVTSYERTARTANEGFLVDGFRVLAPFAAMSKADIVTLGATLGVPFAETWSCYRGGERHCGRCGTCVERREAFDLAGVPDPTLYVASDRRGV